MSNKIVEVLDLKKDESLSILPEIKGNSIAMSIRGNVFGQFGRFLTKNKKLALTKQADKIDAQVFIDKLLNIKASN